MPVAGSHVCLDLPKARPPKDRSTSSSNPMMERPCADSVEKHEPVSDTNTAFVDGRLTPAGRLEKQDITAADVPPGASQGGFMRATRGLASLAAVLASLIRIKGRVVNLI